MGVSWAIRLLRISVGGLNSCKGGDKYFSPAAEVESGSARSRKIAEASGLIVEIIRVLLISHLQHAVT